MSSGNVGNVLVAQGDLAGAIESYLAGLHASKDLVNLDSSNTEWQGDLANSYFGIAYVLNAQGDLVGALENYREGLDSYDELAKQNPDNPNWRSGLAEGNFGIGNVRTAQGDLPDALQSYRSSLDIFGSGNGSMRSRAICAEDDQTPLFPQ